MSRRKGTRQKRTQRFRDEVNEAYFHRIVDFVDKYKDEDNVDVKDLISKYKDLTLELIDKYPDVTWVWCNISKNPNLTLEWIDKYPDKPWCWSISESLNMTLEWLEKYPEQQWVWHWVEISSKNMFEQKSKEYIAAYRIQQWWYKITLSPEYAIGRRFINRKYDAIFE